MGMLYVNEDLALPRLTAVSRMFSQLATTNDHPRFDSYVAMLRNPPEDEAQLNSVPRALWHCDAVTHSHPDRPALQFGHIHYISRDGHSAFHILSLSPDPLSGQLQTRASLLGLTPDELLLASTTPKDDPLHHMARRIINLNNILTTSAPR